MNTSFDISLAFCHNNWSCWHGDAVVSTVALQEAGYRFDPQASKLVRLHVLPVFMRSVVVQWFPPTIQIHAHVINWHLQLPPSVNSSPDVYSLFALHFHELGTDLCCMLFFSLAG